MKTEIRIIAEMTDEQYEVLTSELIKTSKIIGIKLEVDSSKLSKSLPNKKYEINFDGNVLAGIEICNNQPKVYGAMNGYGIAIDINNIEIKEQ